MNPELEKQIRDIIRDEFQKNYFSGSPKIPPHTHNGIDNLQINADNILGLTSGSAGGSNTQVQFNDDGSFGGDTGLTYNKTTAILNTHTIQNVLESPNDGVDLSIEAELGTNLTLGTNNIDSSTNPLGDTGYISIATSPITDPYNTGDISLITGDAYPDPGTGVGNNTSGDITISTGLSNMAVGDINIATSDVDGNPVPNDATGGGISLTTGFAYGDAGDITIQAGNSVNANDGEISITTGNGPITINAQGGSGSGSGDITVATNAGTIIISSQTQKVIVMQYWILLQEGGTPGFTPGSGGILYTSAGALHYIGSSGTDTVIAPA